jgi:glycine/D-amino acid oxidase-like deaminating enzyme
LAQEATRRGVILHEDEPVKAILTQEGRFQAVRTSRGRYLGAELIVCAGNFTPYLLPELAPYFKITGHPVFHVKPSQPELFTVPKCAVFAADTSNSGWYGFPLHPHEGVIKIGLHSNGKSLDPTTDLREVSEDHHRLFKSFLKEQLPSLVQDPIVYTRLCCYTDTLDGHYWIDRHPDVKGLTVASGGSGHGFKMGPIIGGIIADVSLTGNHAWSKRYQWRELGPDTTPNEEARFIIQ